MSFARMLIPALCNFDSYFLHYANLIKTYFKIKDQR